MSIVGFKIDSKIKKELEQLAKARGVSVSELLRQMLAKELTELKLPYILERVGETLSRSIVLVWLMANEVRTIGRGVEVLLYKAGLKEVAEELDKSLTYYDSKLSEIVEQLLEQLNELAHQQLLERDLEAEEAAKAAEVVESCPRM